MKCISLPCELNRYAMHQYCNLHMIDITVHEARDKMFTCTTGSPSFHILLLYIPGWTWMHKKWSSHQREVKKLIRLQWADLILPSIGHHKQFDRTHTAFSQFLIGWQRVMSTNAWSFLNQMADNLLQVLRYGLWGQWQLVPLATKSWA
jgi:hypothetical protein